MSLTDIGVRVRNTQSQDTSCQQSDNKNLFLPVQPNDAKQWRLKYRINGKKTLLALMATVFAMSYSIAAHAQQVVANGTTQTASGTINTGVLPPTAGYALYALNGGIIQSFIPLTLMTGGTGAHAAVAESGGRITLFSGSSITTTGQDSSGLAATSATSTITATNLTVSAANFGSFGVGAIDGATITLNGGNVTSVNSALRVANGGTINATNVTATATGGNANGVLADNGTINFSGGTVNARVGAADIGLLSSQLNGLIDANGVAISANGDGIKATSGSTQIFTNGTINSGVSAIATTGGATVSVENSILTTGGNGIFVEGGSTAINLTGTTLNNGASSAALAVAANGGTPAVLTFVADDSTLAGAATTASGSSAYATLQNGSQWSLNANSNLTNLFNSASQIGFTPPVGGVFKTLTTVNYVGVGGTIGLHAALGGDGSPADQLIIDGGMATGTTVLSITNAGGLGAQTTGNGILVVDAVNRGTTAPGSFTLAGGSIQAGGNSYTLFRGSIDPSNPNAWYLRTPPIPSPPDETSTDGQTHAVVDQDDNHQTTISGVFVPSRIDAGKPGSVFVFAHLADNASFAPGSVWFLDSGNNWHLFTDCRIAPAVYTGELQRLDDIVIFPTPVDLTPYAGSELYIGYGLGSYAQPSGKACSDMMVRKNWTLVYTEPGAMNLQEATGAKE